MKQAYFVDGDEIVKKVNALTELLIDDVFYWVTVIVLLATSCFIFLSLMRVKRLAKKMTAQIITLYETLY